MLYFLSFLLHIIQFVCQARLYRVKIGARNEFGWNYSEEEFVFGTKGAGEIFFQRNKELNL